MYTECVKIRPSYRGSLEICQFMILMIHAVILVTILIILAMIQVMIQVVILMIQIMVHAMILYYYLRYSFIHSMTLCVNYCHIGGEY